jgi:hypothetical protein
MSKLSLIGIMAALALTQIPNQSVAQSHLATGTVSSPVTVACPNQGGVWGRQFPPETNPQCDKVSVDCRASFAAPFNNIPPATAYIHVMNPTNMSPPYKTIFTHAGADGYQPWNPTDPTGQTSLVDDWVNAGFQVVQVAWDYGPNYPPDDTHAWQDIGNNSYDTNSIIAGACRPATLMKYVYNNPSYHNGASNTGAYCALGDSAGGGAVAHSMAYYNLGAYVDKITFFAGPPIAQVSQGCQVICPGYDHGTFTCSGGSKYVGGNGPSTACTATSQNGGPQFGCRSSVSFNTQSQGPNNLKVTYTGAATGVDVWADSPVPALRSCRNDINGANSGNITPTGYHSIMSYWQDNDDIGGTLNGATGATFTYQGTTVTGYVCGDNLNNHAGEANLYYLNFTSSNQFFQGTVPIDGKAFVFNIVIGCDLPTMEDVTGQHLCGKRDVCTVQTTTIQGNPNYGGEHMDGYENARDDMINKCVKNHY